MTDYTKATGASGTMMIRDTGTYVEFWLKAGSSTFDHSLPWAYVINGVTSSWLSYDFASGGTYQKLGSWNVTTDQTVSFKLGDTGTSGLGGPTTLSVAIDRTSAPGTPGPWVIGQIKDTSVQGDVDTMPNGGLAIDQIQVRYDDNTSASTPSYASDDNLDGWFWIGGLPRGKTFYFWVRTHNSKGWSPWSSRTQATTTNYPPAPTSPVLSKITQTTLTAMFNSNGDGGTANTGYELGYGTSSSSPETIISSSGTSNLTGLLPGVKYYFWSRAKNAVGYSAWSAASSATMIAGAHINVNGVWKNAVPYVNVNGVWKVALPWGKISGAWRETG